MKPISLLALSVLTLSLSSCSHYFYSPNSHNVPNLREQHEVHANASYFGADEIEGYEVQLAYSPIRNVGLMCSYANAGSGTTDKAYDFGYGHQIDFGAGYYYPLGSKGIVEAYAGYGLGQIYNNFGQNGYYAHRYGKFFVQPAVGFTTDYFDCLFSTRLGYVRTKPEEGNTYSQDQFNNVSIVQAHPSFYVLEPALTLRGGGRFIKFQTQVGHSVNLTTDAYPQEYFYVNLGFHIAIAPRWFGSEDHRRRREFW